MILIPGKRLLGIFLIIVLSTAVLVTGTYFYFSSQPGAEKTSIESFLFWGICAVLLQITLTLGVSGTHLRVLNEMKKLSQIQDFSQPHAQRIFNNMGKLGQAVQNLVGEQSRLLSMRANRITALNSAISMLLQNSATTISFTDPSGQILDASPAFFNRLGGALSGKKVYMQELLSNHNIIDIVSQIEKEKKTWADPEKQQISCTPIFDAEGKLQLCLWEIETSIFSGISFPHGKKNKTSSGSPSDAMRRPRELFAKFMGNFRRKGGGSK
jgi:hypothetical protein